MEFRRVLFRSQTAMEMTGSERIAAPRDRVYRALNDPEVLMAALPGCENIERLSDTEMTATVVTKVGPAEASFPGAVALSEMDTPNGDTIRGEGKGGTGGLAKECREVGPSGRETCRKRG